MQLSRWRIFFLKFVQYLFFESVLVSLDKSVLLHRRCLMSKFSEMLVLVCRKIFSAFYRILHETLSNGYDFPLMQELNPFYPHLVLYNRMHFCSILTDLSNLLFLFHQKFPLVSYDVKNQCRTQSIFRDTVYSFYCKLRLVKVLDESFWFW